MPEYDTVAEAYSRALDPQGDGLDDPVLLELIGDIAGQDVLDLACGQGQAARMLAGLGANVTAVDLSEEMLIYARRHEAEQPRGIAYACDDAQQLNTVETASVDGVLCHMALMDIPDLHATIGAVARVLRQGRGWFVFSIVHPAFHGHVEIVDDYLVDHRYAKKEPRDWLPLHAYHRPLSMVVNELAASGFHIERMAEVHWRDEDAGGVPGLLYARTVKA
jgi:2-polyprenyl-3-methyl-5-hydroxy-6-metoxy-1,4-benzoquinol methylase